MRNTRRSMGDGTLAGRSRIATPFQQGRRQRPATTVIPHTVFSSERPLTLTVEADDVEVPSGADDPVEFVDIVRQNLVPWEGPSDEIIWPVAGTVFFYVEGAWDDLDPGETYAEVLVDDVVVWNVWINASPTAITVTVEAADVDVTDTAAEVTFGTEVRNQGVTVELPTDELTWPVAGVVQFHLDADDVLYAGTVEVVVDEEVAWTVESPAEATELVEHGVVVSDEDTAIDTTGTKLTFRMPFAMKLTEVRASLTSPATTGTFTVDINEGGVSVLSTKLTIDAGDTTSVGATTSPVIDDADLADDAEVTIDVDDEADGTATGLKVLLIGTRA